MKDYQLILNDDLDSKTLEIINKYWEYKDEKFVNQSVNLRTEFDMTQVELNRLVSFNSKYKINIGICIDCNEDIYEIVTSQTGFKQSMKSISQRCINCENKYWDNVTKQREEQKHNDLENPFVQERWRNLEEEELEVFKKIVQINNRNQIFSRIFSKDYNGTWKIVNKLERLSLLIVERASDESVIDFKFSEKFRSIFIDEYKIKNETILDEINKDSYSFNIPANNNRISATSPSYSKEFILPITICFEKDVEYVVGAWKLTDGSININFSPKDKIFKSKDRMLSAEENEILSNKLFPPYNDENIDEDEDYYF